MNNQRTDTYPQEAIEAAAKARHAAYLRRLRQRHFPWESLTPELRAELLVDEEVVIRAADEARGMEVERLPVVNDPQYIPGGETAKWRLVSRWFPVKP